MATSTPPPSELGRQCSYAIRQAHDTVFQVREALAIIRTGRDVCDAESRRAKTLTDADDAMLARDLRDLRPQLEALVGELAEVESTLRHAVLAARRKRSRRTSRMRSRS